jgi:hypothetical protein
MITGMAVLTGMVPAPTRETTIEVEVEDDWTKTVASTPTMSPAIGFSRSEKRSPPAQLPRTLNEVPIRSRKKRNIHRRHVMRIRRRIVKTMRWGFVAHSAHAANSEL